MKQSHKLTDVTGIKPDTKKYRASRDFVLSRCAIGIEIEAENITKRISFDDASVPTRADEGDVPRFLAGRVGRRPPHRDNDASYWKTTEDGSLRNHGIEFISCKIWGEDINEALDQLNYAIKQSGNVPDFSERTSLHIHLDVRNLTNIELYNLVVLVLIFEKMLVRYCGSSREENVFCLPFYVAGTVLPNISDISGESPEQIFGALRGGTKYNGFNILPVTTQGSVEFRYHPGTLSKERIKEWINIIYCLKRECRKVDNIEELPTLISTIGVETYMRRVFGNLTTVLSYNNIFEEIVEGIRLAQDFIHYKKRNSITKALDENYTRAEVVARKRGLNMPPKTLAIKPDVYTKFNNI